MDYYLKLLPRQVHKPRKLANLKCPTCGKDFSVPFWMIKKGRKFCSERCRQRPPLERLMSHVAKDKQTGCWNWTGCPAWGGYGQLKAGGKIYLAHRLMWIIHNKRKVPKGKVVRHTCVGNRKCVNPDHLIIGTQKQNIRDCIEQGRFAPPKRGEDRPNSKLTNDSVVKIREMRHPSDGSRPVTFRVIAKQFGVSEAAIWFAVNKKQWKHVN